MTLAKFGLALFVGWFLVVAALVITWGISAASCESEDCTGSGCSAQSDPWLSDSTER